MSDNTFTGSDAAIATAQSSTEKSAVLCKVEDVGESAKSAKVLTQFYKDGGKTGITEDFGKPAFYDSSAQKSDVAQMAGNSDATSSSLDLLDRLFKSQENPDEIHYRDKAGNKVTEYPFGNNDKKKVIEEPSGVVTIEHVDGSKETIIPEGSFTEERADGSHRTRTPSGYQITTYDDGTREVKDPSDLTITTRPNGDVEYEYPDNGRRVIYHSDGTVEHIKKKIEGETAEQARERELDETYKTLGLPPRKK